MRAAPVIAFAVLTVASGYVAFYSGKWPGGAVWDVAFLTSAIGFLAFFIQYLMRFVAADVRSDVNGAPDERPGRDVPEPRNVDRVGDRGHVPETQDESGII